jgi:hypothetical protein
VVTGHWNATSDATATHRRGYDLAAEAFGRALTTVRAVILGDLKRLEDQAEAAGAPWTPGRVPEWRME